MRHLGISGIQGLSCGLFREKGMPSGDRSPGGLPEFVEREYVHGQSLGWSEHKRPGREPLRDRKAFGLCGKRDFDSIRTDMLVQWTQFTGG